MIKISSKINIQSLITIRNTKSMKESKDLSCHIAIIVPKCTVSSYSLISLRVASRLGFLAYPAKYLLEKEQREYLASMVQVNALMTLDVWQTIVCFGTLLTHELVDGVDCTLKAFSKCLLDGSMSVSVSHLGLVVMVVHLSLFISCLKLWTTRSANPLGWYGDDVVCFIPFSLRKVLNSYAINCGPLSDKICFGSPYLANMSLNVFAVLEAVVEFICTTFNHLLWLSTKIKNICFWNDQA